MTGIQKSGQKRVQQLADSLDNWDDDFDLSLSLNKKPSYSPAKPPLQRGSIGPGHDLGGKRHSHATEDPLL